MALTKFLTKPWLKAYSGLSINISAAWFIAPFIGSNVSLPDSIWDFLVLSWDLTFGILFLLTAVWCERRLGK